MLSISIVVLLSIPSIADINNPPFNIKLSLYFDIEILSNSLSSIYVCKTACAAILSFLAILFIIALKLFQIHENQAAIRWINESLSYAPTNAAKKSWIVSLNSLKKSIEQTDESLKIVDKSHE